MKFEPVRMRYSILLVLLSAALIYIETNPPEQYIYVHIFGAVAPIPGRYSFDAETLRAGARFVDDKSRIYMGSSKGFPPETDKYIDTHTNSVVETCGLKTYSWIDEGVKSVLLRDKKSYLWFVDVPEDDVNNALLVLCKLRNA